MTPTERMRDAHLAAFLEIATFPAPAPSFQAPAFGVALAILGNRDGSDLASRFHFAKGAGARLLVHLLRSLADEIERDYLP